MFDYRGNLSGRQKAASMLIGMPIAMGAGWLFGRFVERKAQEMDNELTAGRIQARLHETVGICADRAAIRDAVENGKFAVSLVGGALIGKAVGETSKAAVYHSTK
jgi:hypothetical protein